MSFLKAAEAVREAVEAHTGRVRSVDSWRGVAAPVLDRKRLSLQLWSSVLEAGVDNRLFSIDRISYSYPVLVPLEPSTVEVQVVDSIDPEEEEPEIDDRLVGLPEVGTVFDGTNTSILVRRHEGSSAVFRFPGGAEKKVPFAAIRGFLRDYQRREGPYHPDSHWRRDV